jgi:catechol 2,3-dioxygenase-like lactoylglutathione lyase family enzyme
MESTAPPCGASLPADAGRRRPSGCGCRDRPEAPSFKLEDISRKLAFFADPFGNLIELAEVVP